MRPSSPPQPRAPLSRETAWACLTTNLAMPGAGSLAAGRLSGYAQIALALGGMAISLLFGVRFIWWFLSNWSQLQNPDADPVATLGEIWRALKWPLLGLGLFVLSWLWALVTSLGILREARANEQKSAPNLYDRPQPPH